MCVGAVQPGELKWVEFTLKAPAHPGKFRAKFKLVSDTEKFGKKLKIKVHVTEEKEEEVKEPEKVDFFIASERKEETSSLLETDFSINAATEKPFAEDEEEITDPLLKKFLGDLEKNGFKDKQLNLTMLLKYSFDYDEVLRRLKQQDVTESTFA